MYKEVCVEVTGFSGYLFLITGQCVLSGSLVCWLLFFCVFDKVWSYTHGSNYQASGSETCQSWKKEG